MLSLLSAPVPKVYEYGIDENTFDKPLEVLVLELMGQNISKLFNSCNKEFDVKTCLLIIIQFIKII